MDVSAASKETTFQYDDDLPALPVPSLEQTLAKYLDSVKPFVTEEEFRETEKVVKEFENGIGRTLHEKLVEKSKTTKNWLEEWWEDKAYLESRLPLGVVQNFSGPIPAQESFWPPADGTQLERASIIIWHLLNYYQLIRKEKVPVEKNRSGSKIFAMNQFRRVFNSYREPGLEKDTLRNYFKTEREGPCPNHLFVMCNGHIFKMVPFDKNGQTLTPAELYRQFSFVKERSRERGQGIGALTADDRTTYSKALEHLLSLDPANQSHLDVIKTSIKGVVLDDGNPKNSSETCKIGIAGPDAHNRWFDKSYMSVVTQNGVITNNLDHIACEGIIMVTISVWIHDKLLKSGGAWQAKSTQRADLPMPREMLFTIDERVQSDIAHATETYRKLVANYDVLCSRFDAFGKDFLKKNMMHPDGTTQLALQLAYYTMHGRPGAAYETATLRQFYHGRTETMRSCTPEAIEWCQAMLDPNAKSSDQLALLRRAHDTHNMLMIGAASGQGIDRHLLGLYCISQETGVPIPEIFMDRAFMASGGGGNFPLSTSTLGYTPMLGAIAPMMTDGYMICYRIGNDVMEFTLSSFKNSSETDGQRFFQQLTLALNKIGKLLLSSGL